MKLKSSKFVINITVSGVSPIYRRTPDTKNLNPISMKTGRDIKFIIYQVLYIFVICVIALKGADINLEEVLDAKTVIPKSVADEMKRKIDSLLALGIKPELNWDESKIYSKEDVDKMLAGMEPIKMTNTFTGNFTEPQKVNDENRKEKEPPKTDKLATVQGIEFTQYTRPKVTNPYSEPLEIYGDGKLIVTIPSKSSATVPVNGESSFTFKVGDAKDTKSTKEKQSPKIDIQKVGPGGPDASLRSVQNAVGFRVTVISNYPGDLDVKIGGPVSVNQVKSNIFDVTLTLLGSENAFKNWSNGKEEPYKSSFTVSVKDKYNPKLNLSQIGVFTFGKW